MLNFSNSQNMIEQLKQFGGTGSDPYNLATSSGSSFEDLPFKGSLFVDNFFNPTSSQQVFNSLEALKNRRWQEYMSNTAYQRAVEDIKKAGLNPGILYGSGGSGASTGSSSSASSSGAVSPFLQLFDTALKTIFAVAGLKTSHSSTAFKYATRSDGVKDWW